MAGCESIDGPGNNTKKTGGEEKLVVKDPRNLPLQIDPEELDINPQKAYGDAVINAFENKQQE